MYYENRKRARTINNKPTKTEQSGAAQTDINVIVKSFKITGRVPGASTEPMAGDFSELPTDLREMIETAKGIKEKRQGLPPQLRDMPIEELLALTPDKLANILTPPQQPKTEEPKT